ncbi:hypothetical protein PTSG_04059 [Salpingoeca rosetta]|uniref:Histone-lysine N-methyltransferase, H3 lysine-79 specific n=1 Tax=Salpingoeca rosetta (strain ATCC 50818 / BSB-021) TaxID=946362 RepID=F2U7N5_SALR5|nr:uncharacterized protein PTSG_04059 [Salpingoeca rosetta]EGD83452.1 hypothetical protein PTSG_04059 [Salpingoeca rosetta]|eukprot:XP_004994956.1 hypothetical protein PTSG_04059 [Salpingoeca rosetta]
MPLCNHINHVRIFPLLLLLTTMMNAWRCVLHGMMPVGRLHRPAHVGTQVRGLVRRRLVRALHGGGAAHIDRRQQVSQRRRWWWLACVLGGGVATTTAAAAAVANAEGERPLVANEASLYKLLHAIYNDLDADYGIAGFAALSDQEEDDIDESGGHSAYGEILPQGVTAVMQAIQPHPGFVFYDLGSGLGKMAMQVFLQFQAGKACGVELAQTRHEAAQKALARLTKMLGTDPVNLQFVHGDIMKADVRDADVVYLASLCFEEPFLTALASRLVGDAPRMSVLISIQPISEAASDFHAQFKLETVLNVPMSWGNADVHVYRRPLSMIPEFAM